MLFISNSIKLYLKLDENENTFRFLARANNHGEKIWKIYSKFSFAGCISQPLVSICSIIFCWLTNGELEVENLYHPVNIMWVNWKVFIELIILSILFYLIEYYVYSCSTIEKMPFLYLVYRGIKKHCLDTWAKFVSLRLSVHRTLFPTELYFCSSFQCVYTIRHFTRYSDIHWKNWKVLIKIEIMKRFFLVWFVCTSRSKSEYQLRDFQQLSGANSACIYT